MILDKRNNPLYPNLIELALDVVQAKGREVELKIDDGGPFEYAELVIYWHQGRFEASLTSYWEGRDYPGTLYEPPETVYDERNERESFIKIKALSDWAKSHYFDLDKARKAN
jgi:hypothetical protein